LLPPSSSSSPPLPPLPPEAKLPTHWLRYFHVTHAD
jgi:hypothetical protein